MTVSVDSIRLGWQTTSCHGTDEHHHSSFISLLIQQPFQRMDLFWHASICFTWISVFVTPRNYLVGILLFLTSNSSVPLGFNYFDPVTFIALANISVGLGPLNTIPRLPSLIPRDKLSDQGFLITSFEDVWTWWKELRP